MSPIFPGAPIKRTARRALYRWAGYCARSDGAPFPWDWAPVVDPLPHATVR